MSNSVPPHSISAEAHSIEEENLRELLQTKLPKHQPSPALVSDIRSQAKQDPTA